MKPTSRQSPPMPASSSSASCPVRPSPHSPEFSLCLVKPSGFAHRQAIEASLSAAGFSIVAKRELTLNRPQAHRIYYEHAANPDFLPSIEHLCSGAIAVFLVERLEAIKQLNLLLGPSDPVLAKILHPSSLRALYGLNSLENSLDCPFSPTGAFEATALVTRNWIDCFFHTEPKRIILFGPPLAGKGSQCEMLVKSYDLVHISTGDLLRAAIKQGNSLGKQAKSYMEAGELVPDELITELCLHRLHEHDCSTRGWVLDGFPRTAGQAKRLIDEGLKINRFVFLSAERERLVERAVGRRLDPNTGKIYHLKFNPPPAGILDRLLQRPDDREEVVRARLDQYFSSIGGVVRQFTNVHVVEADGNGGLFEVFHQIVRGINEASMSENHAIRESSATGRERLKAKM